MAKLIATKTPIDGLLVIEPTYYADSRGYFFESFNKQEYEAVGINVNFVQDNESKSSKNVVRGLHFQIINPQSKLVRVIKGEVYDVAVDLRPNSQTYGKWYGVLLSGKNKKQFFIPKGFAHGFSVLEDDTIFAYKCDDYYTPSGERGILWNDSELNIDWVKYINIENIILSEKDKNRPTLKQYIEINK